MAAGGIVCGGRSAKAPAATRSPTRRRRGGGGAGEGGTWHHKGHGLGEDASVRGIGHCKVSCPDADGQDGRSRKEVQAEVPGAFICLAAALRCLGCSCVPLMSVCLCALGTVGFIPRTRNNRRCYALHDHEKEAPIRETGSFSLALTDRACVFLGGDRSCVFLGVDRSCSLVWNDRACSLAVRSCVFLGGDRSCVLLGGERSCVYAGVDGSCVLLGVDRSCSLVLSDRACSLAVTDRARSLAFSDRACSLPWR